MDRVPGSHSQRDWVAWSVAAPVAVLTIIYVTLRRALTSFRLVNEDFALLVNSSRPYFSLTQWHTWFTEGYTHYFENYPSWPIGGYGFARPVMNLVFYLQSLATPLLGDRAYLIALLLPLGITIGMLVPLFGRYARIGPATAGILAIAVGLSPVWHQALVWPAIATNTLAAMFSVAALLLLKPERGLPGPGRMTAVATLLVLAMASHEASVVMPFVCATLLYAFSPVRPRLRNMLPLTLPLLYLGVSRLLLDSTGVYALETGMAEVRGRVVRFLMSPLLPYEAQQMLFWDPPGSFLEAMPVVLAIAGNIILVIVIVVALFRNRTRDTRWSVAALAVASSIGLLMFAEPRFMAMPLVLGLAIAFRSIVNDRKATSGLLAMMLLANAALFFWGVVRVAEDQHSGVLLAGRFFDSTRETILETEPTTVVLVNDRVGYWASRAMLEAAAWPRDDIELVVLNNYQGAPDPHAELEIDVRNDLLSVTSILGAAQHLRFDGGIPDFSKPNGGFDFEPLGSAARDTPGGAFTATRELVSGDRILVVGINPGDESFVSFMATRP